MGVIFYQGAARKVQRQWKLRPPNDGSNLLVINLHMLRLPARSVLQLPNGQCKQEAWFLMASAETKLHA